MHWLGHLNKEAKEAVEEEKKRQRKKKSYKLIKRGKQIVQDYSSTTDMYAFWMEN